MIELTVSQAEYLADWLNEELGTHLSGMDIAMAVDAMNSVLSDLDPLLGYDQDPYDDIGVLDG
jgi:hypothetical protein